MKRIICSKSLGLLLGLMISLSTAHSQLLFQETFESLTNGDLNGQNGFTALTAADVETGGLSYAGLSLSGGTKNATFTGLTPANNWVLSNTFAAQSGTVYFSLALTWTNQQPDDLLYFALSNDTDTTPVALGNSGGIVINGFGGAAGQVGGRIRNDSSVNTTQTSAGVTVGSSVSTTQFIVGSLSKVSSTNYNTLNIWVNPTTLTEGASNLTITRDMGIASGLDTFFVFSGASNENDEVIKLDNISIGTTYGSVVAVVPEPSTYAMLAAGLVALGVLRRRQKRS